MSIPLAGTSGRRLFASCATGTLWARIMLTTVSPPPLRPSGGLLALAMLWGTIFTAPSASIAAKPWTSSVARKTW